jgi:predicted enzyme related to lactoylglutathione lyase
MANPVVHFEIMGNDADAMQSFYGELFGWKITQMGDGDGMDYRMVDAGEEGGIGGGIGKGPDGTPAYQTFYVGVDDVQAALDKAKDLGGQPMMGPMEVPGGGTIGMFTAPEGHVIGVWKGAEA